MGTIFEKLAYTKQAREEIRAAIVEKGAKCPSNAPFCTFDDYIKSIQSGGGDEDLSELLSLIGDGKIANGDNWQSLDEIIALIGGDTTSVEKQLQELIELSNKTTKAGDDTLTDSISTLVDGYGQGGSGQGGSHTFHFHQREALYHIFGRIMPEPTYGVKYAIGNVGIIGKCIVLKQEVQE